MKSNLYKILLLSLVSALTFANPKTRKIYTEAECVKLGLQPIILPSGEKIMPQDNGTTLVVATAPPPQPTADVTAEQVRQVIQTAKDAGKKVYDFLSLQYVSSLPIVIEKQIAGATYAIALDKLIFTPAGNTITLMAMITTPDGNSLCFAGEQIGFTGQGGIREGTLRLLLGGNSKIKLFQLEKVALELTQGALKFGCNGYESFSIGGNVVFDRSLIVPDNIQTGDPAPGNVKSTFLLENVKDWNDMLIEISMQPFQMPSMPGYGFSVSNAVIDVSDHVNSPNCAFPRDYTAAATNELWRGVYIGNVTVRFPKHFKNRTSGQRLTVGVNNLLVDGLGVSGEIFGENLLAIKDGDLNGWDYSIDGASVVLVKNRVKAGSLKGKMRVSISSEEKLLSYQAIIDPTRDYYNFNVSAVDNLDFEVFKAASVQLEPASTVSLTLESGTFSASAMLHGRMSITSAKEGISLADFTFQSLFLSTKAPYLSVGYFGGGSDKEYQLGGFPISIVAPNVIIKNNVADISIGVKVNLDDVGISAMGGFVIQGAFVNENNRHFWRNQKIALNQLSVEADLSFGNFKGTVAFFNDDPTYGKGFYGEMQMNLSMGNDIGVSAVALFGRKEKRYWFVDGELSSGGGGSGLSINVLAGCLYKHMAPVAGATGPKSLSGVVYAPDFNIGWGGRFAVGLSTGGSMTGLAGLEVVTRTDGSLSKIGIIGSVLVAGSGWMVSPGAAKAMYHRLCSDSDMIRPGGIADKTDAPPSQTDAQKFDIDGPKGFGGSIVLKINFDNRTFYGEIGVFAATQSIEIQAFGAFYFAPNEWFIHLGRPPLSHRIIVLLPGLPQIDGYIMLGHGVAELPMPEPNIFTKYPSEINKRKPGINSGEVATGKGIAFGAAVMVSSSGAFPKNASKPILGYSVGARIGLDMMLMRYAKGAYCLGREGQPIGINNWRAAGQVYAIGWLKAQAFGFNVLDIGLGAILGGSAPNPTYGAGEVAVSFKVLFKRFNFSVGFSVGDDCVIMGGDAKVESEQVFESFYPAESQEQIAKGITPTVTFTNAVETPTQVESLNGSFRQKVMEYSLTDQDGNAVAGAWSASGSQIRFNPANGLPAGKKINVKVHTQFQKEDGGNWQAFNEGGSADTFKEYWFMTAKTAEDFKEDLNGINQNAQTEAAKIKADAQEAAKDILAEADRRGDEILDDAQKAAEAIKEKAQDKADEILKKAEEANIPQEKKEEVKQIVNTALVTVGNVTDEALKKVDQIVAKAKAEVKVVTRESLGKVETTMTLATTAVTNYQIKGEADITIIQDSLIATKKELARQRRKEMSRREKKEEGIEIIERYRILVDEANVKAQSDMQDVVDRVKRQAAAEMATAKQRAADIMAAARVLADRIMDKANQDAKAVMADAQRIADDIMAEAERQSNAIIGGASSAHADLTAFARIAQANTFNLEIDGDTPPLANDAGNAPQTNTQDDINAEIERQRQAAAAAAAVTAAAEAQRQAAAAAAEAQRQAEAQAALNAEAQRQLDDWNSRDATRKQRERDDDDRNLRKYEAQQKLLEAQQQQQAYAAQQKLLEAQKQQQIYEANLQKVEQEQQNAHEQQLQQGYTYQQKQNNNYQQQQQYNNDQPQTIYNGYNNGYAPFVEQSVYEW